MDTYGFLKKLFDEGEGGDTFIQLDVKCHDCGKELNLIVEKEGYDYNLSEGEDLDTSEATLKQAGGLLYVETNKKQQLFAKCHDCYKADSTFHNYKETEVWSRTCGYLRPQGKGYTNPGKTAEWNTRKFFNGAAAVAKSETLPIIEYNNSEKENN